MEGRMEGKRGRGRPRQKLMDLMLEDGYENFKEKANYREEWSRWTLGPAGRQMTWKREDVGHCGDGRYNRCCGSGFSPYSLLLLVMVMVLVVKVVGLFVVVVVVVVFIVMWLLLWWYGACMQSPGRLRGSSMVFQVRDVWPIWSNFGDLFLPWCWWSTLIGALIDWLIYW